MLKSGKRSVHPTFREAWIEAFLQARVTEAVGGCNRQFWFAPRSRFLEMWSDEMGFWFRGRTIGGATTRWNCLRRSSRSIVYRLEQPQSLISNYVLSDPHLKSHSVHGCDQIRSDQHVSELHCCHSYRINSSERLFYRELQTGTSGVRSFFTSRSILKI